MKTLNNILDELPVANTSPYACVEGIQEQYSKGFASGRKFIVFRMLDAEKMTVEANYFSSKGKPIEKEEWDKNE